MSLRDRIKHVIDCVEDAAADAILALVRAHLTSDAAVEAGARAVEAAGACVPLKWLQDDVVYYRRFARAAILAALGEGE